MTALRPVQAPDFPRTIPRMGHPALLHAFAHQGQGLRAVAAAVLAMLSTATWAAGVLPTGGQVTAGSASITQAGQTMTITQTSARLATDWQQFDIGRGYTVQFVQPSRSAVAFNRVIGPDVSTIQGALKANGQVFLINPNGVLFTPTAQVNVGALVASTLALSADDGAGRTTFTGPTATTVASPAIVNQGSLQAAEGGAVALISARIDNSGSVAAPKGQVLMGAGSQVTLDLGGPVKLSVDRGAVETWIANGGVIRADGGQVLLTSRAAGDLTRSVINHTGVTQAESLATGERGEIILFAHDGTLQAGGSLRAPGGFVETSGQVLAMPAGATVTAAQWLVDPVNLNIDASLAGTVQSALASGHVTLTTSGNNTPSTAAGESGSDGDITVNAAIQWSANTTLTLSAHRNITINQAITATGANGGLALQYGQGAVAAGNTASYAVNAPVSLRAGPNFTTRLGSDGAVTTYTVITSLGSAGSTSTTDLQGINGGLAGNYALGADIDASSSANWNFATSPGGSGYTGFTSLGSTATPFTGTFEGLGHRVDGLYQGYGLFHTGLFGQIGAAGVVRNLGVTNIYVAKAGYNDNTYLIPIGAVAGGNAGTLRNVYSTGQLNNGGPDYNAMGGLVGINTGSIDSSTSSATISSANWGTYAGGIAGTNSGTITRAYATGALTASGRYVYLGGLVGRMTGGSVSNAYATNALTSGGFGNGSLNYVGGLIGAMSGGTVTNTYATGLISTSGGGGLVYQRTAGTVSNSFWDTSTTGRSTSAGGTGRTTTQMKTASTFTGAGWSSSNWGLASGINSGYPVLVAFYPDASFATPIYLRLISGSSVYGNAPTLTYGLYTSSSGGSLVTDASPGGSVIWSGALPSANSGAGSYSLSYGSGVTLGNSSYTLRAGAAATWTVTPRPITVTANDLGKVYGDADPALTYRITTGSLVAGDLLYGSLTRSAGEQVGRYTIDAGGLSNSNYLITAQSGSLSISPRPITVTADSLDKVYGASDPALSYRISQGSLVAGDRLSGTLSRAAGENVGHYLIDASSLANPNYLVTSQNGTLTISPRPLTVTVNDAAKTYGNADPAWGYTVSSGSLVGNDQLSGSLTRTPGENAGRYTIDGSALGNGNYRVTVLNGTLTIDPRPITVTASDQTKVYGNADPGFTYAVTGGSLVGTDQLTGRVTRAAGENVGLYVLDASGLSNPNYTVTSRNGSLSITPRPITVTADDQGKTYGNADPALTYTVTTGSLVSGDALSGSLKRAPGENVGRYTIDASGLANGNYLITAQNGLLTIRESAAYNAAVASLGNAAAAVSAATSPAGTSSTAGTSRGDPPPSTALPGSPRGDALSRVTVLRGGINLGLATAQADEPAEAAR